MASQSPMKVDPVITAIGSRPESLSKREMLFGAYRLPRPLAEPILPATKVKELPKGEQVVASSLTSASMILPVDPSVLQFSTIMSETVVADRMEEHKKRDPSSDNFAFWFSDI